MRDAEEEAERARRISRFRDAFRAARVCLVERVFSWRKRARDRRLLERRDDRLLRDIVLDRGAVEDESTASFWRLP